MTFLVGTFVARRNGARRCTAAFPVDLLILLVGVTYLFGVAADNGTVDRIVEGAVRLVRGRRALIPWTVFVVASLPAMAGALGSAGVAMLAPLSMRLAERYDIDRRMVGLMVVHGAAAGNFSPLNVLGAIVQQALAASGLETVGDRALPGQPRLQRRAGGGRVPDLRRSAACCGRAPSREHRPPPERTAGRKRPSGASIRCARSWR